MFAQLGVHFFGFFFFLGKLGVASFLLLKHEKFPHLIFFFFLNKRFGEAQSRRHLSN